MFVCLNICVCINAQLCSKAHGMRARAILTKSLFAIVFSSMCWPGEKRNQAK